MNEEYLSIIEQAFEYAFKATIDHEGAYVNDLDDTGGETKYGVSQSSYPSLDIKNLTLEEAKEIYFNDFWIKGKYYEISNRDIAAKIFDLAVNMGVTQANKLIQRALRAAGDQVLEDGIIGPITIAAINKADPTDLLAALKSEAAGYYRLLANSNPSQQKFINGWLNRAYS
jgi:lysozyme family protein